MGKVLVTGIDIGHYSMKAVVLRESKEQLELMHFHELLMPEGIFADNHTLDHQSIVKKLAELKRKLPWRYRNIAAAIPDGAVNSKMVQVAQGLEGRELEFAIGQAFDFSLFESAQPAGNSTITYQAYAARKEVVEGRLLAFKKSGLKAVTLDIHSNVMSSLWRLAVQRHADKAHWMLVDIGHQHTALFHALSREGGFFKDIPCGMKQIQAGLGREKQVMTVLTDNIKRQITLHNSVHGDKSIEGIWLSGGGANSPDLVEYLKAHCQVAVAVLSSLSLVTNTVKQSRKHQVSDHRHRDENIGYSTALGLAITGLAWLKERRDD
ncbi:pilus assembly protein PilM [Vibrio tapetis]|uniref:Putative Type IV pilus assembly protein PilM n=1 Tax=Vibrio tapetis subsp. tapetis TaxID=1671868 RepID=A0A2N8ZGE5_9VIBR|nr:pilus assembly protein PilM [Vibrio tapetis]SON50935.1 putative Type IV pilus assembly protein PilM [Vibrio tapetis subsp. tapetis]